MRSKAYDKAVRYATDNDNEDPIIITAAAGNLGYFEGGLNYNSIATPGSAKNIITVGATENYNPGVFEDDPNPHQVGIWPDPDDSSDDRGSARGWTDDNRVKPDLVAPGENVTSPNSEGDYQTGTGTSYANPAVAGAAANIVEMHEDKFKEKPSPSLVKALLINTAEPLEEDQDGDGEKEYIPNKHEGWGSVNLANLFDSSVPFIVADHGEGVSSSDSDDLLSVTDNSESLNSGENHSYKIVPSNSNEPLKVTLTWTDEPGNVGDDYALKNNLDLFVNEGEDGDWNLQFTGNAFDSSGDGESDDGWTKPGTAAMGDFTTDESWPFDRVNNVQNVFIPPNMVEDEIYSIGVEGTDVDGSQDYALVVQNAEKPEEEYELTIDSTEGGNTDPEEGTYTYPAGATVDLSANPHYGYEFDAWYVGGDEYYDPSITVTMDKDKDAYATFSSESGPSPTSLDSDYSQYLEEDPMAKELAEAFRDEDLSLPDAEKDAILAERNDGLWNVLVDDEVEYLIVEKKKEIKVYSYET
ncbi:MAG: S8 family serine peptidase [Thermoplasmata archaeon]